MTASGISCFVICQCKQVMGHSVVQGRLSP